MSLAILALDPLSDAQRQALQDRQLPILTLTTLATAAPDTDLILYGWHPQLGQQLLQPADSQVRWIQTRSAGVDYLPLSLIRARQVLLSNASGVYSDPIADSVIGYLLFFLRGLNDAVKNQAGHFWQPPEHQTMTTLHETQIVIYGTGSIGRTIAHRLAGFEGHPIGVNHDGHPVAGFKQTVAMAEDHQLLPTTNVIINTLPHTAQTDHYFNRDYFQQLDGVRLFVNVGREASVDQNALMAALVKQQVLNAALDVFETEPLPQSSPLWDYPNVLITPHSSGFDDHYAHSVFAIFERNLTQFLADGTLSTNQVDPIKGY